MEAPTLPAWRVLHNLLGPLVAGERAGCCPLVVESRHCTEGAVRAGTTRAGVPSNPHLPPWPWDPSLRILWI